REEEAAVRGEGNLARLDADLRVAAQLTCRCASLKVPDTDAAVRLGDGQPPGVRGEREGGGWLAARAQVGQSQLPWWPACCRVPTAHPVVPGDGKQLLAVGGEMQGVNHVGLARQAL